MNAEDISQAKDPDLRHSMDALRRAAELARKTAIQTGTELVIIDNGQVRRIPTEILREQVQLESDGQS